MFHQLYEHQEHLGAVLLTLRSKLSPFTHEEYSMILILWFNALEFLSLSSKPKRKGCQDSRWSQWSECWKYSFEIWVPNLRKDLRKTLDRHSSTLQRTNSATADDTLKVHQKYLEDPILPCCADPLEYWSRNDLAKHYLCTPESSVPCERVFSKPGEVISKIRNQLEFE